MEYVRGDSLIQAWLDRNAWTAPSRVYRGVIWVGSEDAANDVTSLLNSRWPGPAPQPTVGIWEEVPRAASAG